MVSTAVGVLVVRQIRYFFFSILLLTAVNSSAQLAAPPSFTETTPINPWGEVKKPTSGNPQSIGSYSYGCLRGAQALPISGEGYQTVRPSRNRLFGHPDLITFITEFAREVHAKKEGDLIIGDMGQPRGGPTLTGHASHQTGLDVDIWLWQPARGRILSETEREELQAPSYVVEDFEGLKNIWTSAKLNLLKTAALSNRVQRIFVNPVIKREACRVYPDQAWIQKLRPWWGHDDHFHVRLRCPVGDTQCLAQPAVESGLGCDGSLKSWFTRSSKELAKDLREHPTPPRLRSVPRDCRSVLNEN